jgi:hypothetical protein
MTISFIKHSSFGGRIKLWLPPWPSSTGLAPDVVAALPLIAGDRAGERRQQGETTRMGGRGPHPAVPQPFAFTIS